MTIDALNSGQGLACRSRGPNTPLGRTSSAVSSTCLTPSPGEVLSKIPTAVLPAHDGQLATIVSRPRGSHLPEKHIAVDGRTSGSPGRLRALPRHLRTSCRSTAARGRTTTCRRWSRHLEARFWNDGISPGPGLPRMPHGAIVRPFSSSLPGRIEMEEILSSCASTPPASTPAAETFMFSIIKCSGSRGATSCCRPQPVTMTVPFIRAYTELSCAPATNMGRMPSAGWRLHCEPRPGRQLGCVRQVTRRQDPRGRGRAIRGLALLDSSYCFELGGGREERQTAHRAGRTRDHEVLQRRIDDRGFDGDQILSGLSAFHTLA